METKLTTTGGTLTGPVGKPTFDLGKMSARCIFATDALDRVGDVLDVRGIDTAAHRKNPVVLFDHGKWFGDPIGKTVDPDGNYTVEIGEHEAYQTTFFFPTEIGEQYFALVEMGGLNTNSIGYRPTKKRKNTAGGFFLDAVELVELSWVGVPANGECVRAFLSRDKVCGKSLHPSLRAALEAQLPPKTTVISGGFTMAALKAHKSLVKAALAAAKKELPPEEVKETPAPVAESPAETPAPIEEAPAVPAKLPLGAELLQAAHSHLAEWIAYCDENLASLENDDVAAELLDLCEGVYENLGSIADLYAQQYPDLEPLPEVAQPDAGEAEGDGEGAGESEGDETAEGDEESKEDPADGDEPLAGEGKAPTSGSSGKSYSGEGKRLTKAYSTTIKECSDHLTEMKDAENLTAGQKLVCKHYAKELGSMCEQKEQDAVVEDKGDAGPDEIEKAYDALSPEDQKAFEAEMEKWVVEQEHNARLATAAARRNR